MGSLVCVQAQDELTTATSKAGTGSTLRPRPRPTAGLTVGKLHAAVRQSRSRRVRGAGAGWFGECPRGARAQPPVSGESLLVFEALS